MIRKILKSKKAEGYLDIVIGVIALVLFLIVALSVFSFITLRIQMDRISEDLMETATYSGSFGKNFEEKVAELQGKYFYFDIEYSADEWFNYEKKQVQLGTPMYIKISVKGAIAGSTIALPMTLTVSQTGQSEQYWRVDEPEYDTGHNDVVVTQTKYALNKANNEFHLITCALVGSIPEGMDGYTNMEYSDIIAMGFRACSTCKPHQCTSVNGVEHYSSSHHWGKCSCGENADYVEHLWEYDDQQNLYFCTECPAVDDMIKKYCENCGEVLYVTEHKCDD